MSARTKSDSRMNNTLPGYLLRQSIFFVSSQLRESLAVFGMSFHDVLV